MRPHLELGSGELDNKRGELDISIRLNAFN